MSITAATENPFNQMARQVNKMLDQMQKGYYAYSGETWTPNVNLYENDCSYLVCVDLAGVDKEKIDIELTERRLKLRGTRVVPSYDDVVPPEPAAPTPAEPEPAHKRVRIHLMEIDHGAFSREVELPQDINRENITASYRNGMLWIEIPKG